MTSTFEGKPRKRIGEMLVLEGLVEPAHVDEALMVQRTTGGRIGTSLRN
jgi:hypothetical protein